MTQLLFLLKSIPEMFEWVWEQILVFYENYPIGSQAVSLVLILFVSWLIFLGFKKYFSQAVTFVTHSTKTGMDDAFFSRQVIRRLSYFVPLLILLSTSSLMPKFQSFLHKGSISVMMFIFILLLVNLVKIVATHVEEMDIAKSKNYKSWLQLTEILIYLIGGLLIISYLANQSPWVIISGVGALMALVLLIFRTTILAIVASVQVSSNNLLKVGDWIEMPQYGADGEVMEISLQAVKVQNWDKTYATIPTHKFLEETFKNWRGMQESGGRRIKRSIFIDISSIQFCTADMIEKYKKVKLLTGYIEQKEIELNTYNQLQFKNQHDDVNGRRMTNLGTFRAYALAYLKNHPQIHQQMTIMVRQLPTGENGLPLEIYAFSKSIDWIKYETVQSDIFDHLLAFVPYFDLQIFQSPAGKDIRSAIENIGNFTPQKNPEI